MLRQKLLAICSSLILPGAWKSAHKKIVTQLDLTTQEYNIFWPDNFPLIEIHRCAFFKTLYVWTGRINHIFLFYLTHFPRLALPWKVVVIWHRNWTSNNIDGQWPGCCQKQFSAGMDLPWYPPQPTSSSLHGLLHTIFLRRRRSFLGLFIMKRRQFPCLLGSGSGGGGDRKWLITCQPWWVASR